MYSAAVVNYTHEHTWIHTYTVLWFFFVFNYNICRGVYLLFKKPLGSCRDHKYNLIYRPEHPSKSNAIGRCGGDENAKWLRRTDQVESKTIQNRTGHN